MMNLMLFMIGLRMLNIIVKENMGTKGVLEFTLRDAETNKIVRVNNYKNIMTTAYFTMIGARLVGGSDDTDITYGAVGTGSGTLAISDTTLWTEEARGTLAGRTNSSGVITLTAYFGAGVANETLTEFGWFGNGATGSADSGTLMNHAIISETKTSSETLTVQGVLTIA